MEHQKAKTSVKQLVLGFIVLISLSWLVVKPLWIEGFFSMHDDTQIARVEVMKRALLQKQFPVRWVGDLGYGYGYPLFNFYGPLPYYVGGGLAVLGISSLVATKIMFALGILALGCSTYLLVSVFWGPLSGAVAGLLAVYAPYHAVQIYVRGAVGEFWANAFVPLVILGFLWTKNSQTRRKGVVTGALALGATILSHTLTGYVAVMVIIGYIFWYLFYSGGMHKRFDKDVFLSYVYIVSFGMGLSSFFWLPAFVEMQFTSVAGQIGSSANYRDHFVCFSQFWNSPWGFGGSIPGCVDGLSFKLGKVQITLATMALLFFANKYKKIPMNALVKVAIFMVVCGIFMATNTSLFFWDHIPLIAYIQYPWRYVSYIELGLAIVASMLVGQSHRVLRWIFALIIVILCIWNNGYLFAPLYSYARSSDSFVTPVELRYRASKVSDEYLPPQVRRPMRAEDAIFDTIDATSAATLVKVQDGAIDVVYKVSTLVPIEIQINRANFPGWVYRVNEHVVSPVIKNGLPNIAIGAGESKIEMHFRDTPVRIIANIMTVLSVILILIYGKTKKIKA